MKSIKKVCYQFAGAALMIPMFLWGGSVAFVNATESGTIIEQNKEYTIRYELDGGENNEKNPDSYQEGVGVSSLAEPYKFEHNFEGWYFDASLQNKADSIGSDLRGNIVLYAKWSRYDYDYNIIYNTNYGFNGEHNPSGYYEGVGVHALEEAYRTGYTFEGWYLKDRNNPFSEKIENISETASGDIAIEAKFTPNIYQIKYELGEGIFEEEAPEEYTYGVPITEFPVPVLENKRLEGWYTDREYTSKFQGIEEDTIGDITLYAKYKDAEAESIKLDTTELTLMEKETGSISVTEILPEDTVDKSVSYRSENEDVATVDEKGTILAVKAGKVKVYAKVGNVEAYCQVIVEPLPTPTPTVTPTPTATPTPHIYKASFVLSNYKVKATKTVSTKVNLESGDGVKKYTSSNSKVAKVDQKGVIRGVKPGTAQITIETIKGAKAVCKVTVTKNVVKTKKITLTNVKKSRVTLKKGKTFKIKAKLSPSTSTQKLTYKTSKKKIATVSAKGVIKGKKKGNCIITVTSGSKSKKILLTVK